VSALRELQLAFRDGLLGDPGDAVLRAIAGDGLEPAARLQIYRHHVLTTLGAALAGVFPAVRRLVDPRFFAYAADAFVRAHPPSGACLGEYGADFGAFLDDFPPCRPLPYLGDVARLEWAVHAALRAPDTRPLDPERLAAVAPDDLAQLRLRLDPCASFLTSAWPVDRVWEANRDASGAVEVDVGSGSVHLEVCLRGDEAVVRRLDPAIFAFRRALAGGEPLGAAAERALALDPALDLTLAIRQLLDEEIVIDLARERGAEP